jgi:hypothetical protein
MFHLLKLPRKPGEKYPIDQNQIETKYWTNKKPFPQPQEGQYIQNGRPSVYITREYPCVAHPRQAGKKPIMFDHLLSLENSSIILS